MYVQRMEWFCLLLVVLLVAGTIIVVLFSRINSLENRIQTQEGRTFARENLPPVISSLPEIPEELNPPVLETGEPVVSKPLHYPTNPALASAAIATIARADTWAATGENRAARLGQPAHCRTGAGARSSSGNTPAGNPQGWRIENGRLAGNQTRQSLVRAGGCGIGPHELGVFGTNGLPGHRRSGAPIRKRLASVPRELRPDGGGSSSSLISSSIESSMPDSVSSTSSSTTSSLFLVCKKFI